ncbi:MAG: carbohydrate kinase family protein [Clostridiales bacterium]|nr:carbohydrate kinase family protein [Clostridiales bacterium]
MKDGIAVAGVVLVDEINEISAYPKSGELTKILSVSKSCGGCVPNVSVDLKRILNDLTVKAIGKIGRDDNGKFLKELFIKNGVDSSLLVESDDKTAFTQVISVAGGERTFFTYAGANKSFGYDDIDFDNLGVKMFHLGYFLLLDKIDDGDGVRILKTLTDLGIKTSIDLVTENSNRYQKILPCLPYVDNLIINEVEACAMLNKQPSDENLIETAKLIKDLGVRERVIIHSPRLAVCVSNNGSISLPSYDFPSDKVVGTTGAGDAFCAGALISIYQEKSDIEILEFAQGVAVTSLTKADAIGGVRSQQETINFCKNLKRKELC